MQSILLYGATGWIGNKLKKIFEDQKFLIIPSRARLDNPEDISREIQDTTFDYCVLSAGITRDPKNLSSNIDYCEDHVSETININVIGCVRVVQECYLKNKCVIYLGTGCIYEYDENHRVPSRDWNGLDSGFNEYDTPNFDKSIYSFSKIKFEEQVKDFNNILILRIRMPIDYSFHPRNFITKITKYERVINIPNSMSVLEDLLPLIPKMLEMTGKLNFVNPGVISHNEILDLYREMVDENFRYMNFTLEDQMKVVKTYRSNNALNTNKLQSLFPEVPHIQESIKRVMEALREIKKNS
jgi:UDP-glucose 4,6-dehydratase